MSLDRERASALGRKGAAAKWAKVRAARAPLAPYPGSVLDLMDVAGLTAPSWAPWRALLKAAFCLGPLSPEELVIYERHAGGRSLPQKPVRELWAVVGRRGSKTTISALLAAHRAISRDWSTVGGRGEQVVIPVICADRRQARQQLNLLRGLFTLDPLKPYLTRALKNQIETRTHCVIEIATADHRLAARGFTTPCAIADEVAHWRSETTAQPDVEVIRSLRPSMLTVPDALLFGASSPYAARGVLHEMHARYFGQDDERVLVVNGDTRSLHPGVDEAEIDQLWQDDAVAAASEYGRDGHVAFRTDVSALFDAPAVDAVIASGRRELPPRVGLAYGGACDPSGGVNDDMVLSIGHLDGALAVVDLVRIVSPRFDPAVIAGQFAEELRRYRVGQLVGDRYSAGWVEGAFRRLGITYIAADKTASEAFRSLLAIVNSGGCQLLDLPKVRAQVLQLERRMTRTGHETISHPPGAHDDAAACVALLVSALQARSPGRLSGPVGIGAGGTDGAPENTSLFHDAGGGRAWTQGPGGKWL